MFLNINDKESIKRAKKMLNSYRRLDRIARASYSLKSLANYQQTKTKGTRQRDADHEKHLLKVLEAEQERLGYEKSRFYELQNEALLMFAEIYDGGRLLVYDE